VDTIKYLILASRPKTLVAGLCPVFLGASYAYHYKGQLDFFYLTILVLASVCIQVATNFFNDALDADEGRDSEDRLGPVRAASTGALTSKFLKISALFLLMIAVILGFVLALKVGFWVFAIGLPAVFLAYLYTGSRFSLSMNGTADFFVLTYFGVIPVWATTLILSDVNSFSAALSGLQLGLFANALLLINNLRDLSEDSRNNKNTLIVRFGRNFGLCFLAFCFVIPYVISFSLDSIFFRAGLWTMPLLVLSIFIFYKIAVSEPSTKYNKYLGLTALNLVLFTYFFSKGIISS